MERKIPYGRQEISEEDIEAVVSTLRSDYLTQGPKVLEFEKAFALEVGADYALSCSNGTAALHLSMMALDLKPGQKVLTTSITFAASANCVLYMGAEVEFIDISLDDYLLDLNLLENHLASSSEKYAGVIVVDFAGLPTNLERLRGIVDKYGMWIVEDACHAPGGSFVDSAGNTQKIGGSDFADLTVFSFHPVKHIACGEGGMITTQDKALSDKLEILRSHGITKNPKLLISKNRPAWYHEMQNLGYNYRISDIQAALGLSQLSRLEASVDKRNIIAKKYNDRLSELPITLPRLIDGVRHAFHLYVIRTDRRDEMYNFLVERGIYVQLHYIPVYLHPYYESLGYKEGICPNAEIYFSQCLSLPMYPSLTDKDLDYVIDEIFNFLNQ